MINRLEWAEISAGDARKIAAAVLFGGDLERLSGINVNGRRAPLPFYTSLDLVELILQQSQDDDLAHLFVLSGESGYYTLDGSGIPIHMANKGSGLRIDEETAPDYLRFYCFAVRGEGGPFLLFEESSRTANGEESDAAKEARRHAHPLTLQGTDENGRYLLNVSVKHGTDLFTVDFAVAEDGEVEMVNDEHVLGGVPAELFPDLPEFHSLNAVRRLVQLSYPSSGVFRIYSQVRFYAGMPALHHWLRALIDHYEPMVRSLVPGLDREKVEKKIEKMEDDDTIDPILLEDLLQSIREEQGEEEPVTEKVVVAAILERAGYEVRGRP